MTTEPRSIFQGPQESPGARTGRRVGQLPPGRDHTGSPAGYGWWAWISSVPQRAVRSSQVTPAALVWGQQGAPEPLLPELRTSGPLEAGAAQRQVGEQWHSGEMVVGGLRGPETAGGRLCPQNPRPPWGQEGCMRPNQEWE